MKNRDDFLNNFRGNSLGYLINESTFEELFQNEVLRPILKLQNELLIATFRNYILRNKIDFANFSLAKKIEVIENAIHKDTKIQNVLKGIIIGLFTAEEYSNYTTAYSSLNKRMMSMLIERLKNQVAEF